MARIRRRLNSALSAHFPEKRLFVQSRESTCYLRLTPLTQLMAGAVGVALIGWLAVATARVVVDLVAHPGASQAVVIQDAYRARLEALADERDQRAAEARSAQERFQVAMAQISRQQSAILQTVEERRELATALDTMRERLAEALAERDSAADANDRLLAKMTAVNESLTQRGASDADLTATLRTISAALSEAVADRDLANEERGELAQELADLELKAQLNAARQDEMVDELEQAVAMSFGPLEELFRRTDLDVDSLIATVRGTHSGVGGPLGTPVVSTRAFDNDAVGTRFDRLMLNLDRMNLMRIAASKIPYAMPLQSTFRFTSGFGPRGGRRHAGVDFAAPRGTPIFAAAEGVVKTAERESGYGNVVRIQHAFGLETVYAHLSKIRVRPGQTLSRGVQIGDMGSTGRSTGSHLHYEVRVNGQPVNPMTYLEAAKDVF
jgi:murein DD-endopeptidase MepM/ murein hydrolase activator NlpD